MTSNQIKKYYNICHLTPTKDQINEKKSNEVTFRRNIGKSAGLNNTNEATSNNHTSTTF